ncbi:50S ribosome-binding GTPase [bacterium]|nr:50S ribosome-binding GTPase [bacterium]
MPANLTPGYKKAEAAFRAASEPGDRLTCLRDMLRELPKHKGTDHLRADIQKRIKEMTADITSAKKSGARGGPPTVIRPEGAAQIALLGAPNSGKSALHTRLTGAHSEAAPYPFATQFPQPGMHHVDDITVQLVDLPSISPLHPIPWIANAVQPADGALLVVDFNHPGCVEEVVQLHEILEERRIVLTRVWPFDGQARTDDMDPFTIVIPTLIVATKSDLVDDIPANIEVLRELTGYLYPALPASAETGEGLEAIGPWLLQMLEVARVYTKIPGKPPDMSRPFTVRRGASVHDVAVLVHKDIAAGLKYARMWRKSGFEGVHVGPEHSVEDGDVLELHI